MKALLPPALILPCILASWLSAAEPQSGAVTTATEKAVAAQILAGRQPKDADPRVVEAIRRIDKLAGQCEFDSAGRLVGVDLASDRVSATDADIPLLRGLPNLTRLSLSGTDISGPGIDQICKLIGLTELSLMDAQVDNTRFAQLAQLANLRSLTIRRNAVLNDEGILRFKPSSKLTSLGLLELGITDRSLAALAASAPQLRFLDLRGCSQVGDRGLAHLRAMKSLRVLRLSGQQVTDASMAILRSFDRLGAITIEESAITDAGLKLLGELPLEEINLGRCYGITDAGLRHLKTLKGLRQLGIRGVPLDGSGLRHLGGCDKLVRLKLVETGITDAAIEHLRGLKSLARLELRQTQVTDAAIEVLGRMKTLEFLDLSQTGVTEEGVKRLAHALPRCKIVCE